MFKRISYLIISSLPLFAAAQTPPRVASESRDAATAYIFTQTFIIGRTARDCFEILGRTDTPKDFVALWQKRNVKYFSAALTYMDRRLIEAESLSGVPTRNATASALNAAIAKDGTGAVSDLFKKDEKQEVCKRVINLMEAGAFDIDSRSPMYGELQALVNYVGGQ
jgi:hypothetical protein